MGNEGEYLLYDVTLSFGVCIFHAIANHTSEKTPHQLTTQKVSRLCFIREKQITQIYTHHTQGLSFKLTCHRANIEMSIYLWIQPK